MSGPRSAVAIGIGIVALLAAKAFRHADEARMMVGPVARAALHEVEDGHAADALQVYQFTAPKEEERRQ